MTVKATEWPIIHEKKLEIKHIITFKHKHISVLFESERDWTPLNPSHHPWKSP
jgi:hypothetical protein